MIEPLWWLTKDGDVACLALYERHYSAHRYKDGRIRKLFVGPGDKVVLRTEAATAFFVWRKFKDKCIDARTGLPQAGINCAAFRNEGAHQSSELGITPTSMRKRSSQRIAYRRMWTERSSFQAETALLLATP